MVMHQIFEPWLQDGLPVSSARWLFFSALLPLRSGCWTLFFRFGRTSGSHILDDAYSGLHSTQRFVPAGKRPRLFSIAFGPARLRFGLGHKMSDTQQFNYALSHLVRWLGPCVQLAILIAAIVAARRHKLKGLWLLAGAAAGLAMHDIVNILLSPTTIADNATVMLWWIRFQYVPFFAALAALCGWCVLAFNGVKGKKPDA